MYVTEIKDNTQIDLALRANTACFIAVITELKFRIKTNG